MPTLETHHQKLKQAPEFVDNLSRALELLDKQQQTEWLSAEISVDGQLYDGFIDKQDQTAMRAIRAASPEEISSFSEQLRDPRHKALLPLYKARNFPASLSEEERAIWDNFCAQRLLEGGDRSRLAQYMLRTQELLGTVTTDVQRYLLEELRLYGESLLPTDL
jgi:exodeoxyribonuclease-1